MLQQDNSTDSYKQVEVAPCPTCKEGVIIARKEFYGCSAYKSGCKQTFPGIFLKKKLTPSQVKLLCTKGKTNVIKGFLNTGISLMHGLHLKKGKLKIEF